MLMLSQLKKKLVSNIKDVNIAIIGAVVYHAAFYLKKTQDFAIFLRDFQY